MTGVRVLVTGSRGWVERTLVRREIASVAITHRGDQVTLVHGAAKGADLLAAEIAEGFGFLLEPHPADWERDGKAAGPLRNRRMLDSGIDLVLGFHLAGSRGTQHALTEARQRDIPTIVWSVLDGLYPNAVRTVLGVAGDGEQGVLL